MYIYYFAVAATVLMVSKDYQFSSDFVFMGCSVALYRVKA